MVKDDSACKVTLSVAFCARSFFCFWNLTSRSGLSPDPCFQTHAAYRSFVRDPERVLVVANVSPEGSAGPDRHDVKPAGRTCSSLRDQVIASRIQKVGQLHIGYGCDRVHEGSCPTRSNFHEDKDPPFQGDDIDLSGRAQIVALKDTVAAEKEVTSCGAFSLFSGI